MFNDEDIDEKELEALRLIDQAENLADGGNGEEAINIFEAAAQIYLDLGSYFKLDELFIRISKIISKFKNNIQAMYRLKSIIRKTEELDLDEITAKLLIQLGSVSYKMNDWETAGESWKKASDIFYKIDSEEYYNLSSELLLRAGQAYERSHIKKDEGKRLILKAVMKISKFDEIYENEEKRGLHLLSMEEYEASANKFFDIASYFRQSLNNIDNIFSTEESTKDTKYNTKARFIHFVAEYQTVAALCLRAAKDRKFNEKIRELGEDSLDLFQKSIALIKKSLIAENADFDKEILYRITFDTMLLAITQGMLGKFTINPEEYLLNGIESKALINELKSTPYFKIIERITKIGIRDALEDLGKVNLGHFEKVKNMLITYFN